MDTEISKYPEYETYSNHDSITSILYSRYNCCINNSYDDDILCLLKMIESVKSNILQYKIIEKEDLYDKIQKEPKDIKDNLYNMLWKYSFYEYTNPIIMI